MKIFKGNVSLEEAGLFAFLLSNLDDENYVSMSIKEISEKPGLSELWVTIHLKKLSEEDLIWISNDDISMVEMKIFCNYKAEDVLPF